MRTLVDQIIHSLRSNASYTGRPVASFEIEKVIGDALSGFYPDSVEIAAGNNIPPIAVSYALKYFMETGASEGIIKRSVKESTSRWNVMQHRLEPILDRREAPDGKYDQCLATTKTVLRRIDMMWRKHDLIDKKILLLGDDDYLSLGIALLKVAKEVVIVEADTALARRLADISHQESIDVTVLNWDYRLEPPQHLINRFDVIFADPPYTQSALLLVISRSLRMLKIKGGNSIYLCYSPMDLSSASINKIQRVISSRGLVVTDLCSGFNEYIDRPEMIEDKRRSGIDAEDVVFTSSLTRLLTIDETDYRMKHKLGTEDIYEYETWS